MPDNILDWVMSLFVPIVLLLVTVFVVWAIYTYTTQGSEYQRANQFVTECVKSDQYTREECIIMAGGDE